METWAIFAVLAALGLSFATVMAVMSDRRKFSAIPRDGGIYEAVRTLDEDLAHRPDDIALSTGHDTFVLAEVFHDAR